MAGKVYECVSFCFLKTCKFINYNPLSKIYAVFFCYFSVCSQVTNVKGCVTSLRDFVTNVMDRVMNVRGCVTSMRGWVTIRVEAF
jgi:hypothetical protein